MHALLPVILLIIFPSGHMLPMLIYEFPIHAVPYQAKFEKHSLEGEEFLTVLTKMIGHEEVLLESNLASMVEAVAKVRQRQ